MEWKRVFGSRISIALLLCLLFVNGVSYGYYIENGQDTHIVEGEYERYIRDYPDKVNRVVENADSLSGFAVFSQEDSFAVSNIEKTVEDYGRVKGVRPVQLDNEGLASLFSFEAVHLCVFVFGFWLVLMFVAEKKNSMEILLHTCRNGRVRMFVTRFLVLLAGMAAVSFLLYLQMFGMTAWKSGIPPLSVPIQSLSMMGEVTLPCSIWQFMLAVFLVQVAGSVLAVMALWLVLFWIRNIGIGICAGIVLFGAEYVVYSGVGIQSNLCLLRYMNVFFSANLSELWERYLNVRVGESAISSAAAYCFFWIVSMTVVSVLLFLISAKRYPVGTKGVFTVLFEKAVMWVRKKMAGLPIFVWELYKVLWCQKGVIIAFLFVCLMWWTVDDAPMYFEPEQEYLNYFYELNSGPLTDEKLELMRNDGDLYKPLEYVEEKISEGRGDIWLVNDRGYEVLAGKPGDTGRGMDGVLSCVCLLLVLAGCMNYEGKREMLPLLRCSSRGQGWLYRRKHIAADIIVVGVWGIMVYIEWRRVSIHYALNCLGAPVQSLPFLSDITLPLSIGAYLAFMAAVELVVLHTLKNIVLCLSAIFPKVFMVVLAGLLCLMPVVLTRTLVVRDVFTDGAFYARCAETAALLAADIGLYWAGKFFQTDK